MSSDWQKSTTLRDGNSPTVNIFPSQKTEWQNQAKERDVLKDLALLAITAFW